MELRFNNKEAAQLEHDVPTIKRFHKSFALDDNVFIEGDNLDALKLLQNTHASKIKMIYIDPPYNTRTKKLYKDKLCHDAWASMMYPRLYLARNLLRDDGVIFISIDDNEVHHLRMICDEIFGEGNFVAQFVWQSRASKQNDLDVSINHEYTLAYAKCRRTGDKRLKPANQYNWTSIHGFAAYPLPLVEERYVNSDNDPRGPWKADPFDAPKADASNLIYEIFNPNDQMMYWPPKGRQWRVNKLKYDALLNENRIVFGPRGKPKLKVFLSEKAAFGEVASSWLPGHLAGSTTTGTKELMCLFDANKLFNNPKPTTLLRHLLQISTSPSTPDIILDFFAGSCTTAHAVMKLNAEDGGNRKYIMVQLPEPCDEKSEAFKAGYKTIADIGRERIRRAKEKYGFKDPDFVDVVCI